MKTVLVLEDEPSLLKLLHHMLKEFRVIEASGAEQALQLFVDGNRKIDLLVADLTLPTSSGIQVALLLRSEISKLPVILTSGYPVSEWTGRDRTDLQRLGSNSMAVLQKPFLAQELLSIVSRLTGESQTEVALTA